MTDKPEDETGLTFDCYVELLRLSASALARAELAQCLADGDCRGEGDIEAAAAARHGDQEAMIRARVDALRHAGRFTTEHEHVAGHVGEVGVGQGGRRRKQQEPTALRPALVLEARDDAASFVATALDVSILFVTQVETGAALVRRDRRA